jgi:hypothetical protein
MTRQNMLLGFGALALMLIVVSVILAVRRPPEPGTAAAFRGMSAASGVQIPHSVPGPARRAAADTCHGYNLELEEAAGIQLRIGKPVEARRLLAMRQDCATAPAAIIRSAR